VRSVHLVPHTHWDREWYLTFEEFQSKLVATLDLVLDLLATDDGWTHFHLDGQTAMVDDYLEVRPEREPEIAAHVAAGRLSCGPWVTLVDEFLVSGESIFRNLEDGMRRARELGAVMPVAYLPDQFGHVGQMPQIVRSMGLNKAVVWRGVPSVVSGSGFVWRAPDDSSIETKYLPFGYGQGRKLPDAAERFADRVRREIEKLEPFVAPEEPVLVMAGNDHERPRSKLPTLVGDARERGVDVTIASLAEHLQDWHPPPTEWTGELRSAARANLLPNTYSVRVHQKTARARAEHLLERYAEPLAALVPGAAWPERELRQAWYLLHLNGAHDSVCGCSTDAVAHAVDARTDRATAIARDVAARAMELLAARVSARGELAFNPSPFARCGIGPLGWRVDGELPDTQPLPLRLEGDRMVGAVEGVEFSFLLEDRADVGDLYTFCPGDDAVGPQRLSAYEGEIRAEFDRCHAIVRAESTEGDPFARLHITIDNRAPNHRIRLLLDLPQGADQSDAGSAFEIVRRPRTSEGGSSEPPSGFFPARGFVFAGDRGFLSEGVFEYELTEDNSLAYTLLRCVGTISRRTLATRKVVAGPDVPTPEAQMIGSHSFDLGVCPTRPANVIEAWERYALPLAVVACPGGGDLAAEGSLVDLAVPALSCIRRAGDEIHVRAWNPWGEETSARFNGRTEVLRPYEIRTLVL